MTKHSTKQKQNDIIVRQPSSSVSILGQCLMFQQWVDSVIADRQYVQFLSYVPKVLYCTVLYCAVLYCTELRAQGAARPHHPHVRRRLPQGRGLAQ